MRHMIGIALLALALGALSACSGAVAPSPTPTATAPSPTPIATAPSPTAAWTPAPKVTAAPQSFNWDSPTKVAGDNLLPGEWVPSPSFTLRAGPAMVDGFLEGGSAATRFAMRLVPVPNPASFEGYRFARANLNFLRRAYGNEVAVNGWFPYALPAGRYRLEVRQTSGGGSLVWYDDLDVTGVK